MGLFGSHKGHPPLANRQIAIRKRWSKINPNPAARLIHVSPRPSGSMDGSTGLELFLPSGERFGNISPKKKREKGETIIFKSDF